MAVKIIGDWSFGDRVVQSAIRVSGRDRDVLWGAAHALLRSGAIKSGRIEDALAQAFSVLFQERDVPPFSSYESRGQYEHPDLFGSVDRVEEAFIISVGAPLPEK